MNLGISNKYALITGGSHGIGLATAEALADEGCNVAICSSSSDRLDKAVALLKSKDVDVLGIQGDVLVPSNIERVVQDTVEAWGTVHILVNNVGGGGRWGSPIFEETLDTVWIDVYNKNAMAAVRFTRLLIPFMRKQKWGRVVTVSSIFGREGGGRPWFNMAKSAEISLMKTLSMDHGLSRSGITFNTIAPGHVAIPGTGSEKAEGKDPEKFAHWLSTELPMGRMGTPEEVANVIAFVCSNKASFLNGSCITVDGSESHSF